MPVRRNPINPDEILICSQCGDPVLVSEFVKHRNSKDCKPRRLKLAVGGGVAPLEVEKRWLVIFAECYYKRALICVHAVDEEDARRQAVQTLQAEPIHAPRSSSDPRLSAAVMGKDLLIDGETGDVLR